jgi:hypothetical protein
VGAYGSPALHPLGADAAVVPTPSRRRRGGAVRVILVALAVILVAVAAVVVTFAVVLIHALATMPLPRG